MPHPRCIHAVVRNAASILLALGALAHGQTSRPARVLESFEGANPTGRLETRGTTVRLIEATAMHGAKAAEITFASVDWPRIQMAAPEPWDWMNYDSLVVDVRNPDPTPATIGLRVDDATNAPDLSHARSATIVIPPSQNQSIALHIGPDAMQYGMRGLPMIPGIRSMGHHGGAALNLKHITSFQIFMPRPPSPCTLIVDNVRLMNCVEPLDGIVDSFGQYSRGTWPEKLTHPAQFAERRQAEDAELNQPLPPERDKFGGWTGGETFHATGYFRTQKVNGKWWLVTPEGHLFWSIGIDCVNMHGGTIVTGRERMFGPLPGDDDPLAHHFEPLRAVHMGPFKEGKAYNFFTANLERKYGPNYLDTWFDRSLTRLQHWGFNTIGNWSDQRLYGNGRVPYVATAPIIGRHARVSSGSDYWGKMHDPFDPQFAQNVDRSIEAIAKRVGDDPWCLGYFVDNELSWGGFGDAAGRYGLARGALAESSGSFAKRALIRQLQGKYPDIASLNAAWNTRFDSWRAIESPWTTPAEMSAAMQSDAGAFVTRLASEYFRNVRDALRRHAPHHLYLGCRFAWYTEEAVRASEPYSDVISFNIYKPRLSAAEYPVLATLDKPCMIGEFHSGALDSGLLHPGLVSVANQHERGRMYQEYVRSVAGHPLFVGCHWFQYLDQPLTGRTYDGENYNLGFLTVTDTVYPELRDAAKSVHAELYRSRWKHDAR